MNPGLVLETNDPERVWNSFRLATTALDADHTVEVFSSVMVWRHQTLNIQNSTHTG